MTLSIFCFQIIIYFFGCFVNGIICQAQLPCSSGFDDIQSKALLSDFVFHGRTVSDIKLLDNPQLYNVTVYIKQIFKSPFEAKLPSQLFIIGYFVDKHYVIGNNSDVSNNVISFEDYSNYYSNDQPDESKLVLCVDTRLEINSDYIFFTLSNGMSNYLLLSSKPSKFKKRSITTIKRILCYGCAILPQISKLPSYRSVKAKGRAHVKCNFYGRPSPVVEWRKNNELISQNLNIYIQVFRRHTILHFRNTSTDDTGLYTCTVRNVLGTSEKSLNFRVVDNTSTQKSLSVVTTTTEKLKKEISTNINTGLYHSLQKRCPPEESNYCYNEGTCVMAESGLLRWCICTSEYTGNRCTEVADQKVKMASMLKFSLISIVVAVFIALAIALWCCIKKRKAKKKKRFERLKNYVLGLDQYAQVDILNDDCFLDNFNQEDQSLPNDNDPDSTPASTFTSLQSSMIAPLLGSKIQSCIANYGSRFGKETENDAKNCISYNTNEAKRYLSQQNNTNLTSPSNESNDSYDFLPEIQSLVIKNSPNNNVSRINLHSKGSYNSENEFNETLLHNDVKCLSNNTINQQTKTVNNNNNNNNNNKFYNKDFQMEIENLLQELNC